MLFDGLLIEHQCRPQAVAAAGTGGTIVYRNLFLSSLLGRPIQCLPALIHLAGGQSSRRDGKRQTTLCFGETQLLTYSPLRVWQISSQQVSLLGLRSSPGWYAR